MSVNRYCRHFVLSALFLAALTAPGSAQPPDGPGKEQKPQARYQTMELSELQKLAEQGNAEAQYQSGERCRKGNGVDKDYKQAFL